MIPVLIFGAISIDVVPVIIACIIGLFASSPVRAMIFSALTAILISIASGTGLAPTGSETFRQLMMLPWQLMAYLVVRAIVTTVAAVAAGGLVWTVRHASKRKGPR